MEAVVKPKTEMGMARKTGSKQVEGERKRAIVNMVEAGLTSSNVATYFNMNVSTVHSIPSRYRQQGTEDLNENRGRNALLDNRSMRKLFRCVYDNRFEPLRTIVAEFNENNDVSISTRTARRYIHSHGINNFLAVSKPYLRPKMYEGDWIGLHLDVKRDSGRWDKVIFSDESSFTVKPVSRYKNVWRKQGTRYQPSNMVPTFKSRRSCISVWAAFSALGRTSLVRTEGTLNARKYKHLLEAALIPFTTEHYGNVSNVVFQQDNCGAHRANSINAYMDASNINLMDWSAQSSDLNPIKNPWAMLKDRVYERSKVFLIVTFRI